MPARLRALAAVWLAFTIVSGTTPAVHADLRSHTGSQAISNPRTDSQSVSLRRLEFHEAHMGTDTRIVLYAPDEAIAGDAARAAFDRVEALNRTLSDYQPTSELMQVSARAGQGAVAVSEDLFRVLAAAQDLASRSDGAFDATCGPLTRLWRRARHLSELPSAAHVEEARALTGFRALRLDAQARTVTLAKAGMSLDVGGIAKGYAAEEALNVLGSRGLRRALVAIGGDIAVAEPPPDREGWLIEVSMLAAAQHVPPVGPILLRDAAISTAGDAEQWLEANGLRYSHILDPRTGWPMTVRSTTTVIARHGLDADGLDTTAAVLGPDRGVALVEATPGAAVLMMRLESDGRTTVRTSSRWPPRANARQTMDATDGRTPTAGEGRQQRLIEPAR